MKPEAKRKTAPSADARRHSERWKNLCERNLPVVCGDSVWRLNRDDYASEPSQGWKLHVSATIIEACDVFEKIAPLLIAEDIQFKAPKSLEILSTINCGLSFGYHQIGKFITVYPDSPEKAVKLAKRLHDLTLNFFPLTIPFDEQYAPQSSVFYRYGAFRHRELTNESGMKFSAVAKPDGTLVEDDRTLAVPVWTANPFPKASTTNDLGFDDTPLGQSYRIFESITQRGKGGTYRALDFGHDRPRLCVVKQGRRNGEVSWNGQDGFRLVKNEFEVLKDLGKSFDGVPEVFESFEINGNFYFVMEHVPGLSLNAAMQRRRRRFSIRTILRLAIEIARIINKIHGAGWIWNDCKPANLIIAPDGKLRPLDFESAYPSTQTDPFDWKTPGFSNSERLTFLNPESNDIYALGTVVYFLLTGRLYDAEKPETVAVSRRGVPSQLVETVESLLSGTERTILDVENELNDLLTKL